MIKLGNSSVYYAVMKCVETADYHIIIAVSERSKIQQVFDVCMEAIKRFNFNILFCKMSLNQFSIFFNNNSLIKCIPANESARGNAAHLVIYDQVIDDDIKNCVLRPIEKIRE